jgi:hypothetical protein
MRARLSVSGRLFSCALLVAAAACGSSTTSSFGDGGSPFGNGGSGGGTGGNGSGGGTGGNGSGSAPTKLAPTFDDAATGTGDTDCPANAKLIYVTGEGSTLYSFYPPTFDFKLIGTLGCLGQTYSPTHMTVDRTGTAWVAAWDDTETSSLFTASTINAACTKFTKYTPEPNGDFSDFALTFVGTSSTTTDTTLYMMGTDDNGNSILGDFDTATGIVSRIGNPSIMQGGGDMTTNGNGNLYYLLDVLQLQLYEIAPSNASVVTTYSPNASGGGDQALAFWGGSFYLFEDGVVYQFDPSTNATTMLGNAPLSVTGAGQSTCVPTVAPPVSM